METISKFPVVIRLLGNPFQVWDGDRALCWVYAIDRSDGKVKILKTTRAQIGDIHRQTIVAEGGSPKTVNCQCGVWSRSNYCPECGAELMAGEKFVAASDRKRGHDFLVEGSGKVTILDRRPITAAEKKRILDQRDKDWIELKDVAQAALDEIENRSSRGSTNGRTITRCRT
jgi:hypothetical protein